MPAITAITCFDDFWWLRFWWPTVDSSLQSTVHDSPYKPQLWGLFAIRPWHTWNRCLHSFQLIPVDWCIKWHNSLHSSRSFGSILSNGMSNLTPGNFFQAWRLWAVDWKWSWQVYRISLFSWTQGCKYQSWKPVESNSIVQRLKESQSPTFQPFPALCHQDSDRPHQSKQAAAALGDQAEMLMMLTVQQVSQFITVYHSITQVSSVTQASWKEKSGNLEGLPNCAAARAIFSSTSIYDDCMVNPWSKLWVL